MTWVSKPITGWVEVFVFGSGGALLVQSVNDGETARATEEVEVVGGLVFAHAVRTYFSPITKMRAKTARLSQS